MLKLLSIASNSNTATPEQLSAMYADFFSLFDFVTNGLFYWAGLMVTPLILAILFFSPARENYEHPILCNIILSVTAFIFIAISAYFFPGV